MTSVQKVIYKIHDIIIPQRQGQGKNYKETNDTQSFKKSGIATMVIEQVPENPRTSILAKKLESLFKDAKGRCLECKEVLIPCDLMSSIICDVLRLSQDEPCGLRGCVIYVTLMDSKSSLEIGNVQCGEENTVETFELHLKLTKENNSWQSFKHLLPDFLQKLGKDSTIVISPKYTISKRKLFRSWS